MQGIIFLAVQFIDQLITGIRQIGDNLVNGLFVFGSLWDVFSTIIDISILTFVCYFILKLVRDTRAWQLLKGLVFIILFSILSDWIGLQTMNYVLSSTISFLAIAMLIIFQPELRRALERVGRKTGGLLNTSSAPIYEDEMHLQTFADQIVSACQVMAEKHCGALMIIERSTPMGELLEQRNVVRVDAAVTSMNLQQIFYEGSPMHDGAILIRGGRIYAARCHVPLSDDTRVKDNLGTRHRAAIGASEMGDAVVIVVSEERGVISLAIDGHLYRISDPDRLKRILMRTLRPRKRSFKRSLHQWRRLVNLPKHMLQTNRPFDDEAAIATDNRDQQQKRRQNIMLQWVALVISISLWLFVQTKINPITTVSISIPVQMDHLEVLDKNQLDYSKQDNVVSLQIRTRKKYVPMINTTHVIASLNLTDLDYEAIKAKLSAGELSVQEELRPHVYIKDLFGLAYDVNVVMPSTFYVSLFNVNTVPMDRQPVIEPGKTNIVPDIEPDPIDQAPVIGKPSELTSATTTDDTKSTQQVVIPKKHSTASSRSASSKNTPSTIGVNK